MRDEDGMNYLPHDSPNKPLLSLETFWNPNQRYGMEEKDRVVRGEEGGRKNNHSNNITASFY